tara:strand:- start:811 stop:1257 length:447 start_codon:yes stop_codon:yes gene_type:complete
MKNGEDNQELIYEELSYQLVGGLFDVNNKIGPVPREQSHQDAFSCWLKNQSIPFFAKPATNRPIIYNGHEVKILEPDFDIDGKIILELKSLREGLAPVHETQTLNYYKLWDYRGDPYKYGTKRCEAREVAYSPAPPLSIRITHTSRTS